MRFCEQNKRHTALSPFLLQRPVIKTECGVTKESLLECNFVTAPHRSASSLGFVSPGDVSMMFLSWRTSVVQAPGGVASSSRKL